MTYPWLLLIDVLQIRLAFQAQSKVPLLKEQFVNGFDDSSFRMFKLKRLTALHKEHFKNKYKGSANKFFSMETKLITLMVLGR